MNKLANQLIKMGHTNPELRDHLRPVLAELSKEASDSVHITASPHWDGKGVHVQCVTLMGYRPSLKNLMATRGGKNLERALAGFEGAKMEEFGSTHAMSLEGKVGVVRDYKVMTDDDAKFLKVLRYGSTRFGLYWNDDLEI